MLKKLCFSEDNQFFQISPGIKSLYGWGRKRLFIGRGGMIWDQGGISANLLTGEPNGVHLPRDLDRVSEVQLSDKNRSGFSLVEKNKKQYAYEVKRNLIGVFTFLNTIETL